MKKIWFPHFILYVFFCILFLIVSRPVQAISSFLEEFNGQFDNPSLWTLFENEGEAIFSSTKLKLQSNGGSFPFLHTNSNIFPNGDFRISISFQYLQAGPDYGDGIVISNNIPPNGTTHPGPEHGILGIWQDPSNKFFIQVNFLCPESNPTCSSISTIVYQTTTVDLNPHILEVEYQNEQYKIFLDQDLKFTSATTTSRPTGLFLGNPAFVSAGGWSSFEVDYIQIESIEQGLNIPYFSQKDPAWGSHEYDFATDWANQNEIGIDRWGCALTSASMVLAYHDINKTPDSQDQNPDTLNNWLISQPDGYIGRGLLNWIAVTRFAKEVNAIFQTPKLEFLRQVYAKESVKQKLDDQKPVILHEPGHFLVVKGEKDENTWLINDPYTETRTELAKNSTFYTANTFIPSNTNLAYLLLVVDQEINILVKNPEGSQSGELNGNTYDEIPGALVALEGPIQDAVEGVQESGAMNVLTLPKPQEGVYTVTLSAGTDKVFSLEGFTYNTDGDPNPVNVEGVISPENPVVLYLTYSHTEPPQIEKTVTFKSLIADIKTFYSLQSIKKLWLKNYLIYLTRWAQYFHYFHRDWIAKRILRTEIRVLQFQAGKAITLEASKLLQNDIRILINSL